MAELNISEEFAQNILKLVDKYQHIVEKLVQKDFCEAGNAIDPSNMSNVIFELISQIMSEPDKLLQYQLNYTQNYLALLNNSMSRFRGDDAKPLYNPAVKDNRFRDNSWEESIYFDFIKQSYLMTSEWIENIVNEKVANQDSKTARKVKFYTKQLVDALSPSNFALTNPQVLKETIETKAGNLVKGMEKLYNDIERSNGLIDIATTDASAFEVGVNIALTPGKVIYQNDLIQLIHYQPTKEQNYEIPILIIPSCINKYYILDLREKNSLVKWMLDQGYSVFLISWVNPLKELAHKSLENYMMEGPIAAIEAMTKATGSQQVNAMGYCTGGTLLAITLAYLEKIGQNTVKSASFLTTLLDFSDIGDVSVFLDQEQLEFIEKKMNQNGYFDGIDMYNSFNLLRANDMIWSFFVNNYLLGKDLVPFDLLYWNSNSTRLPAAMHSYYLKNICINNSLIKPDALLFNNVPIDLTKVKLPCYFLSTKEDHIAPWQSTYAVTRIFSGDIEFTLTGSGHVGGVVNPPVNNKYGYWKNSKLPTMPETWLKNAKEYPGSWWVDWDKWLQKHSGKIGKPICPTDIIYIEDAPGSYVKRK